MDNAWDCIVVGAGAAGLGAALVLGRARQRTLVVDPGGQSNRVAHRIGGLLGHDARPPAEFYAAGRDELAAYPTVELRSGRSWAASAKTAASCSSSPTARARRGGAFCSPRVWDYRFPDLPGSWSGGTAPCSTARSATAGRPATSRSECSTGAPRGAPGAAAARLERRRDAARWATSPQNPRPGGRPRPRASSLAASGERPGDRLSLAKAVARADAHANLAAPGEQRRTQAHLTAIRAAVDRLPLALPARGDVDDDP